MTAITYPAKISAVSYSLRNQFCKQLGQSKCKELEMIGQVQLKNSVLCSEHFTKDCIEIDTEYAAKYAGQKKQRRLVKGAIPMIFKKKIRHSLLCFI